MACMGYFRLIPREGQDQSYTITDANDQYIGAIQLIGSRWYEVAYRSKLWRRHTMESALYKAQELAIEELQEVRYL